MPIEDCFGNSILPVNTLAVLNRIIELLKEHKTNSFLTKRTLEDIRIRKCIWLLLELYSLQDPDKVPHIVHLWKYQFSEYDALRSPK